MKKTTEVLVGITITAGLFFHTHAFAASPSSYTVKAGDSLWRISNTYGVSVNQLKSWNHLTSDTIYPGQILQIGSTASTAASSDVYTVKAGDTLWKISVATGVSVQTIKNMNHLSSDTIYVGQKLVLSSNTGTQYTVKAGDTLWKIATKYGTSVESIKQKNQLYSDIIYVGQKLIIPTSNASSSAPSTKSSPTTEWPSVTYIVQSGDTANKIASKFGVSASDILKYNYMTANDPFYVGDKIAISGYAPREYAVTPGEASAPARVGKLVDWFLDGQYLIKQSDTFLITDVDTGKQFSVKMLGGYNHCDIEPLTASDTSVMKSLFPNGWTWTPRAVVIFKDGMNIAASLSGMPHDVETITNNNVSGHFDLYLKNSKSHSSTASSSYMEQHRQMILKAAGQ